jgi:hypothetical protein
MAYTPRNKERFVPIGEFITAGEKILRFPLEAAEDDPQHPTPVPIGDGGRCAVGVSTEEVPLLKLFVETAGAPPVLDMRMAFEVFTTPFGMLHAHSFVLAAFFGLTLRLRVPVWQFHAVLLGEV